MTKHCFFSPLRLQGYGNCIHHLGSTDEFNCLDSLQARLIEGNRRCVSFTEIPVLRNWKNECHARTRSGSVQSCLRKAIRAPKKIVFRIRCGCLVFQESESSTGGLRSLSFTFSSSPYTLIITYIQYRTTSCFMHSSRRLSSRTLNLATLADALIHKLHSKR